MNAEALLDLFARFLPALAFFGLALLLASAARKVWPGKTRNSMLRPILLALWLAAGVIGAVLLLPVPAETRSDLLTLLGIVVSASVTLGSTTFVSNLLAGFMLRGWRNFRPGDFLRVDDLVGRVSGQGLLHTEIQTEESDLVTLPNLHLVTRPVTVVRPDGTIVKAEVSLGYDVSRGLVERVLCEAAAATGLSQPFVQIRQLGDYSVTYRAAGLLEDPKHLIAAGSRLRAAMLDALHGAGIEIVSPSFMNQRRLEPSQRILPPASGQATAPASGTFEELVFGKAEAAARKAELATRLEAAEQERQRLEQELDAATDSAVRQRLERDLARGAAYRAFLTKLLEQTEEAPVS